MRRPLHIIIAASLLMAASFEAYAQKEIAVSTNIAEWLANAKANAAFQMSVSRTLSLEVGGKYQLSRTDYSKVYDMTAAAGVRWWPWSCFSGLFTGVGAVHETVYDRMYKSAEKDFDCTAAYLSCGYDLLMFRHFNIEAGISVWGGMENRKKSDSRSIERSSDWVIRMGDILVSIVYVF